ncbi:MAG: hypothetical protein EU539_14125, partial [Promethearchaeota archaeon]
MIEEIINKIEELKNLEKEIEPKIDELNSQRDNEIKKINQKYDEKISHVSNEVETYRKNLMKLIYDSFEKAIMNEFDAKRSTSEYSITPQIREYKEAMKKVEFFPEELIEKLEKVIAQEEPIENLAYDLEKIESQYF